MSPLMKSNDFSQTLTYQQYHKLFMKSLNIIYNKNKDQQPIKSSQPVSHIAIDHRNNIYISIGSEIRIFSIRRLSKKKDFLINIIRLDKILPNKVEFTPDNLTLKFNDPKIQLLDLKQYILQDNGHNKLLEADRLKQRIIYLNEQFLSIRSFGIASQVGPSPNITILLATGNLITLRNISVDYQIAQKPLMNIKTFKYLKDNIYAAVGDQLLIINDTTNQVLFKTQLKDKVNLIETYDNENLSKLIMATLDKIIILTLKNYKFQGIQQIKVGQSISFLQISQRNRNQLFIASISMVYSVFFDKQSLSLKKQGDVKDQRILMHDSYNCFSSTNFKQNAITKLLIRSNAGLYISFSYDIGRTFKELDLTIAVSNEYQVLAYSLLSIYKSYKNKNLPLNLHDLRMFQNKQILVELQKIALIINDNDITTLGRNIKEKKINQEILDKSNQMIQQLNIEPQAISTISMKFLIHVLLASGTTKILTLKQVIIQVVRKRFSKLNIDVGLLWKYCMFTYTPLKDSDLLECIQCKLLGNKQMAKNQTRCHACWGQLKLIQAF